MNSQIPEDFGSEWDMSDVILHALDSDGKELHANKYGLALFSPYFRVKFFGSFDKPESKHVDVECDYIALKEILRILHHVDRDFTTNGQKQYEPAMLRDLYLAADRIDFPVIRKLCEEQMLHRHSVEMANAAHCLGLHDMLIKILTKMQPTEVMIFLADANKAHLGPQLIFSKSDVAFFYEKTKGAVLPKKVAVDEERSPLNLEEISKDLEEPRIDLGQQWAMSNVSLLTKNSLGRVLHSNKTVLACVSEHFKTLFFKNPEMAEFKLFDDSPEKEPETVIQLDAEYATIKQILSIIHHCNTNFSRKGYLLFDPVLLYDMYRTASVDSLDIPMIRKFCCDNLLEQESVNTFEVAVKLGITDIKSQLVSSLPQEHLRYWVQSKDKDVFYLRDGKEVIITADSKEDVLSVDDLRVMYGRL